jgi:hypothetical protein
VDISRKVDEIMHTIRLEGLYQLGDSFFITQVNRLNVATRSRMRSPLDYKNFSSGYLLIEPGWDDKRNVRGNLFPADFDEQEIYIKQIPSKPVAA